MKFLILSCVSFWVTYFIINDQSQSDRGQDGSDKNNCLAVTEVDHSLNVVSKMDNSKKLNQKCHYHITNKGDSFKESERLALGKVDDLFKDVHFDDYYEDDNEYNVYTHDSGPGKIKQKADPRKDLHARFELINKPPENLKKIGIIKKSKKYTESSMKHQICESPQFYQLSQKDKNEMDFYLLNLNVNFIFKEKKADKFYFNFRIIDRDERILEAVSVWGKGISDYYFSHWLNNNVQHSFMANACNRSISQLSNRCHWDLRFDMQYKDFFYFLDRQEMGVNIFCKKSDEKTWRLMTTYVLENPND